MKINLIDRVFLALSPRAGVDRIRNKRLGRAMLEAEAKYDAAGRGRRGEWTRGSSASQNAENRLALINIRQRHRELIQNNPYASIAVDVTASVTVGEGIMPVAKGGTKRKRRMAQELMQELINSTEVDADGRSHLFGLQSLIMASETESGEVLAQRVIRKRKPGAPRVPLQIRLLESDYLDHQRHGIINGNRVVQGVEFGADKQRTGYYLYPSHPGDGEIFPGSSQIVPAEDIAHIFYVKRPGQVRAIPRAVAAIMKMRNLDDFQDARLEQQKIAACLVGAIVTPDPMSDETKKDPDILPEKLEPGLLARLGLGEDIKFNSPPQISGQHEFVRAEQHVIAKAYGITYQSLVGDLSDANFANGKMGRLDMYANVGKWRRNMLIPQFCKTFERWFLEAAELAGYDLSGISFDWTPPRSEILNLGDEIPAIIKAIRAGLGSFSGWLRSLGYPDPEKIIEEIKADMELFDKFELVLDCDPRRTTLNGQIQVESTGAGANDDEDDEANTGTGTGGGRIGRPPGS